MNQSSTKIQDILGYLSGQLGSAWRVFSVAKHIYQANQDGRITGARYFFPATYLSCTESAVLAISRLTVPHGDSINIEYLLNCCEQNSRAFPSASREEVLHSVSEHREQIANQHTFIENVKIHRDQTICHLDRRYVNDPLSIFATAPIDMKGVENAFELLLRIINTFRGYLDSSELHLASLVEPRVVEDLEYLIGLIEKDNERHSSEPRGG